MIKSIWNLLRGFFSLKWVKWVVLGVVAVILLSLAISTGVYKSKTKSYKQQIAAKDSTIMVLRDSLTKKSQRVINYEIYLAVSDYSILQCKNTGRGTLNIPSTKSYVLTVDSSAVAVQEVDPYKK